MALRRLVAPVCHCIAVALFHLQNTGSEQKTHRIGRSGAGSSLRTRRDPPAYDAAPAGLSAGTQQFVSVTQT